jgi:hypothetical protein
MAQEAAIASDDEELAPDIQRARQDEAIVAAGNGQQLPQRQ